MTGCGTRSGARVLRHAVGPAPGLVVGLGWDVLSRSAEARIGGPGWAGDVLGAGRSIPLRPPAHGVCGAGPQPLSPSLGSRWFVLAVGRHLQLQAGSDPAPWGSAPEPGDLRRRAPWFLRELLCCGLGAVFWLWHRQGRGTQALPAVALLSECPFAPCCFQGLSVAVRCGEEG